MKKILALLFILISAFPAHAEKFIELRIISAIGGSVRAVMPDGTKITLGRILMLPEKLNTNAYTASKWASPSAVSASAVNSVHILVDVSGDRGKIFSLIPSVTTAPAARPKTAFLVDIPAGTGIFGGFAPLTGGRVIAHTGDGAKVIARVARRVRGAGRFGGTKYQDAGRIRASHSGVIDISTSKAGDIGGFQIIPLRHALTSHELHYVWRFVDDGFDDVTHLRIYFPVWKSYPEMY